MIIKIRNVSIKLIYLKVNIIIIILLVNLIKNKFSLMSIHE